MQLITKIDLSGLNDLKSSLEKLNDTDTLLRTISSAMLARTKRRIHQSGLNSQGNPIGTYSDSYLKQRRKRGLGSNTKVILFFTGQMQNDYKIIRQDEKNYGLGFSNKFNFLKADVAENGSKSTTVSAHNRRNTHNIALTKSEIKKIKSSTKRSERKLAVADARLEKVKNKSVIKVRSYTRKGSKGFGPIYNLTDNEKEDITKVVAGFVKRSLE